MTKEKRFAWAKTPNARKMVYRELAGEFDCIDSEAEAVAMRTKLGLNKKPSQYMHDLTRALKLLHFGKAHKGTAQAVGAQVNWATTCQGIPGTDRSAIKGTYKQAFVENITEAHRQGFVTKRFLELPRRMIMEDGTHAVLKIKYNAKSNSYSGSVSHTVVQKSAFAC